MIRFDTRDKKPNLYDLLPVTAVAAVLLGVFIRLGAPEHRTEICVVLGLFYLVMILRLLTAFRGQLQYNPYFYNTIIYSGFALFLLSVLITHTVLSVRMHRSPEIYTEDLILHQILGSAKNYILLSSPFLLIFSSALCTSSISLIRHEGKRLVNVLGIILSFLLIGGLLVFYITLTLLAYR